jgi:hypothetical protein
MVKHQALLADRAGEAHDHSLGRRLRGL